MINLLPAVHLDRNDCLEVIDKYVDGTFQLLLTSTPYPGLAGCDMSVDEWFNYWGKRMVRWKYKLHPETGVLAHVVKFPRTDEGEYDLRIFDVARMYRDMGMFCVDVYIWDKLNAPPGGNHARYDRDAYEFVFVFARNLNYIKNHYREAYSESTKSKSKPGNKPRQTDVRGSYSGGHSEMHPDGAMQDNVLRISNTGGPKRPRVEGGVFPTRLARRLISTFSNEGDRVVDICCGSGTTIVEAVKAGRKAVGIDISMSNIAIAIVWIRNEFGERVANDG